MYDNLVKQNKFVEFCSRAAVVILGIIFSLLSIAAFLETCHFDQQNLSSEKLSFDPDSILINIAIIILIFSVALIFCRSNIKLYKLNIVWTIGAMIVVTILFSGIWNIITKSAPTSDSKILVYAARDASLNDFHIFNEGPNEYCWDPNYYNGHSYFSFFGFQLGYVLIAEMIIRIFGTGIAFFSLKVLNILALTFSYIALVLIANRLFKNNTITNLTAIALTLCFQPMFYTIFVYGTLLGLCFSLWAIYFTIAFMQEEKKTKPFILIIVFMILAVISKYNSMIAMIAIVISLLLYALDKKKLIALILAVVVAISSPLCMQLVIKSYELRANTSYSTKVKQIQFLDAGLNDGPNPGWYNGIQVDDLKLNNMNQQAADETARYNISNRLNEFSKDPAKAIAFFKDKILSEFNEPSFESIWLEQVREHEYEEGETVPKIVESVETGGLSQMLSFYFNEYVMIMYLAFALALFRMFFRKTCKPDNIIIPITIIGGFIYHTLFEAKSQYIIIYFIMLIPYAIYGIYHITRFINKRFSFLLNKRPQKENT